MKKAFLIVCGIVGFMAATYLFWEGLIYARQQLRMRFAQMHEFLAGDGDSIMESGFRDTDGAVLKPENGKALPSERSDKNSEREISWELLSKVKIHFLKAKEKGQDTPQPEYTPEIKALDNQTIAITGFIFPLEQSGKQFHFLLSPYPASCPYCLPAGPSQLIEVWMKKDIPFTFDSLSIKGKFQCLEKPEDIKQGMFYRISNGKKV